MTVTTLSDNLFDACKNDGVTVGHCVITQGFEIVYAGPIVHGLSDNISGCLVHMHTIDFEKLRTLVHRTRN